MLLIVINIIKTLIVGFVLVKYDPIRWILDAIEPSIKNRLDILVFDCIYVALTCFKCASLYIGFIIGGWWCGLIASIIAYVYKKKIDPWLERVKLNDVK